jgi:hypothetical protein
MIAPARTAAFTALCEVSSGRLDLPAALTQVRPSLQDERDRALATDLVTGPNWTFMCCRYCGSAPTS